MKKALILILLQLCTFSALTQINTDRVLMIGRNALYFEDYVLSIQYFNMVIRSKPWMAEPYYFRGVAKFYLEDYKGCEEDGSLCLERNPYYVQAYFLRGMARHNQGKFDDAISDYKKGFEFRKGDQQMMMNMIIAHIQKKDYDEAEHLFDELIKDHPRYAMTYMMRGAMYIEMGDTTQAMNDYNQSITMDPYYPPAYGNRAILKYEEGDYDAALADLNEAIRLDPTESGYYINRGLVRYQLKNLRGAMADYDQVVHMDGNNRVARFNRGLLRYQVGDYNHAIEDFDVVIEQEPDNYMAYYNRALLHSEIGSYRDAIADLNAVLNEYPTFLPAYYLRAEAKRKMNDTRGAERDLWVAYDIETKGNTSVHLQGQGGSKPAEPATGEDATREESDKNINKFNRLVVYDKEEEQKNKYKSDIRGRVQDRSVHIDLEPQYVLTYYEKGDPLDRGVGPFNKLIDDYNTKRVLSRKLIITNKEVALNESQVGSHFESISELSAKIEHKQDNADTYFARAIDFMLVSDFSEAIENYTEAIDKDPDFTMAYFNRAAVRYKQLVYDESQSSYAEEFHGMTLDLGKLQSQPSITPKLDDPVATSRETRRAAEYDLITRDYDKVISLNPDFLYAYFNRGNIRCSRGDYRGAIQDYDETILRDSEFAEAYFNRGLARLSLGDLNRGIEDLSKAGELGIVNAYSIIKRMSR